MDVRQKRCVLAFVLVVYSVILIKLVVFKSSRTLRLGHLRFRFAAHGAGPANFVPLKTVLPYLHGHPNWFIATVNLAGNIVPFVPLGSLVPLVFGKLTLRTSLTLAIAVGFAMEMMEVIFRTGVFDVDDITLNACGVMIGYWLFNRGATAAT